jgi:hypothetical protein
VGAGTTTAGAVGAVGGAIFFLQPATAMKATSSTTETRIRLRRSNGLLLLKKHEHFPDDLPQIPASCLVARLAGTLPQATMVLALIVHEKAMVKADIPFSS